MRIQPRDIEPRDAQPTARPRHPDHVLEHDIRLLRPAAARDRLVAHGVDGPVHHAAVELDDLVHGVALGEVNGRAANPLGGAEPLRHAVYDVDPRSTAQSRRVRGHQTDGAGAEDGDGLAGLEA